MDDRVEELASLLAARGLRGEHRRRNTLVLGAADDAYDAVRDAVAELGVGLRRLAPRGRTLEDVYLGVGDMSTQDARLFDLGYRSLRRPARTARRARS